jgi:hypothetical protein
MKPIFVIPVFLAVMIPSLRGQTRPVTEVMSDAASHEQLSQICRSAQAADPMRSMKPAKGGDPSIVNQPKDLLSNSDIICFGGAATLVPKRAIINLPKNLEGRLKFIPGSKIQSWADFFALNRGWITTVEVSRIQAEGNKALDEKVAEHVHTSTNLVVATYQGGPISVLPLKVPVENPTAKQSP